MLNCLKLYIHYTQAKTYKVKEKDTENVPEDNNYVMPGSGYSLSPVSTRVLSLRTAVTEMSILYM